GFDQAALDYVNAQKVTDETGTVTVNDMADLVTELRAYVLEEGITPETTTAAVTSTTGAGVEHVTSDPVTDGYYLIIDAEATSDDSGIVPAGSLVTVPGRATDGSLSANVTITMKGSLPSINKEVWHDDLANVSGDNSPLVGTSGSWDTVADYEIGDTIEYRITATIPSDLRGYTSDTYTYIISDTLSEGLTLNYDSITLYADASLSSNSKVSGDYHKIDSNGISYFTMDVDVVAMKSNTSLASVTEFYIYYTATVTSDAVIATDYESNTVSLEYSNNPYDAESTDEIEDIVYSYTFDLDILKTEGDGVTGLAGATFALYEMAYGDSDSTQLYLELDTDKSKETGIATYYISTSGTASSEDGIITTQDATAGFETGRFIINGLNDATAYVLMEIDAPEGYNAVDPMYFTINATYTEVNGIPTPSLSVSQTNADFSITSSGLSGTVINTSSALLPETGGMGTTIFMIVGGIMMLGAVTLLVVKRKRG
ncbi:MAG: isopeptide-forming domain-containing fimbrial protein, partial [Eubacteriales bacterium]